MARFFIDVNTVYAVDVDDDFAAKHKDSMDVLNEHIVTQYLSGDCEAIDDSIVGIFS